MMRGTLTLMPTLRPMIGLMACSLLWLTGCNRPSPQPRQTQPSEPPMKAAPATPIAVKKADLGDASWDPAWDKFVEQALPPTLLSADAAKAVRSYCPKFGDEPEADKRAFWAYFFQALAGAEAGLNPASDVHHTQAAVAKIDSVTKRAVRQEGLMQLTYEDAQRYGCGFDWARDSRLPEKDPAKTILDPRLNLECGVRIIENQIVEQKKPLLARTSYWSTLRPGTASYRVFARQMTNVPEACGRRAPAPRIPRR